MQNVVDFDARLLAPAWGCSEARRHPESRVRQVLPFGHRANKAPRLARQIVEGRFQGLKPAQQICGGLHAIGDLSLFLFGAE